MPSAMFPETSPTASCGGDSFDGGDQTVPIAVIGLSLQFPGDATSPEAFWRMLAEAKSARTEIPKDRFNVDAFYHPDPTRKDNVSGHLQCSGMISNGLACSSISGTAIS